MKPMRPPYLALVFLPMFVAMCIAGEPLPIEPLFGKTPAQLAQLSPKMSAAKAGGSISLENWRGWKEVFFNFNAKGKLVGLSFNPTQPLGEAEAKRIVQEELKITLPAQYEKRAPAVIAYRDMPGKIRTVNLMYVDMRADKRIGEIGVFFKLGWQE